MRWIIVLYCFLLLVPAVGSAKQGDYYLVPKAAFLPISMSNADPLYAIGGYLGYGISPLVSVEMEANASQSGGQYRTKTGSGEYSLWFVGAYGVYRFPITNSLFFKGKLGAVYEQVANRTPLGSTNNADALGVSAGLGFGYRLLPRLTLETEGTGVDKDIIQYSLGAHYAF